MPASTQGPDDLYGLPLDDFVAERDALAKGLRAAGDREQASQVAALRKPSVAAWAVNQLARSQARALKKLFKAGDELQRVQSRLLAGRADRESLTQALADERQAVDDLVELARGLLTGAGQELSSATLDRVAASLHAAALEDDARAVVKAGRLERELEHVGLGGPGVASPAARAGRGSTRRPGGDTEHRRAEREQAERLKAARQAESTAGRDADRAERDLQQAQTHEKEAARSLQEAQAAVKSQRQRARRARAEHRRAQAALREAQGNG